MRKCMAAFLSALVIISLCTYGVHAKSAQTFSDVPPSHWAYSYIQQAVDKGYVDGVGAGRFDPDGPVSNAQFVAMLVKAFMRDTLPQSGSNQAEWNPWWGPYMQAAFDRGLLNGMTLWKNFDSGGAKAVAALADEPISRFDMAEGILSMMSRLNIDQPTAAAMVLARTSIADYGSIPSTHRVAVDFAYAYGCLTGIDSRGTFAGDSGMTRAQAAVVLIRLDELNETGIVSGANLPKPPAFSGDMTQGYWLLYDPNPDRMEIYRFYEDGTFEYRFPGLSLNKGHYKMHDGKLRIYSDGSDSEYTYDAIQQGWIRYTTRFGNVNWTEILVNCSTCNDFFMASEWFEDHNSKDHKDSVNGDPVQYRVMTAPTRKADSVDAIFREGYDPRFSTLRAFEIRADKVPGCRYTFSLAVENGFYSDDSIDLIYASDAYLVLEVWAGAGVCRYLSYNITENTLKLLPPSIYTTAINDSFLVYNEFTYDTEFPGSIELYAMDGELVTTLAEDVYLAEISNTDRYVYFAYSDAVPSDYDHVTYRVWRYELTTGYREELSTVVCRSIEEMGDGFVKYKLSWDGPVLTKNF